jgi:hypothetical protein
MIGLVSLACFIVQWLRQDREKSLQSQTAFDEDSSDVAEKRRVIESTV